MNIEDFRAECVALGAKWLPGTIIGVKEFDFGCRRAVAIQTGEGDEMLRHAVRGRARGQWLLPPWWKFWKRPVWAPAMTPPEAIAELAWWLIRRDVSCAPLFGGELADNEEPLG